MRAIADIQAEGLRAAGELLDRVLAREPAAPSSAQPVDDAERPSPLGAWAEVLERFAAELATPRDGAATRVRIDVDGVAPAVRLRWDGRWEGSVAEISLHNPTEAAIGPIRLACSPPADAGGAGMGGLAVRFEPGEIQALAAGSSQVVTVSLQGTDTARPGVYRGSVQAVGAPGLWLPIEVCVGP